MCRTALHRLRRARTERTRRVVGHRRVLHTYGVDALAGAKLALGSTVALRVDGMMDWLANAQWKTYTSIHMGLSMYRRPSPIGATRSPGAGVDSVSASETHRLRARDPALRALRDSLAGPPGSPDRRPSDARSSAWS